MTDNNDRKRGSSDNDQKQRPPTNDDNTNTDHTPTNPPNSAADNGPGSSLASRIHNSASGLTRSAFSASSSASADAASLLAGGGGSGSKAGPSASSRAALSAAQRFEESGAPASSSSAREHSQQPLSGETFRSSSTANQQQDGGFTLPPLSSEEFQSSYGDNLLADPTNQDIRESLNNKGKARETLNDPSARPLSSTLPANPSPLPTDGFAVTTLLSSPSFDPEFPPLPNEPFEPVETDLSAPQPLTTEELQTLDSFRRQISPPPPQQQQAQPHRLTPYSLVPDIDTILNSAAVPSQSDTDATALRDTVLTSLPGSADWIAVDERYNDEVWGYLRPALEAAREEMEARKEGGVGEGGGEEDGPAVRRLKMILKHMGG